ncbi:hypothetical protein SAMN04487900_12543 [Prevotella communis]|uniref:Competence protein CoiA-like family protein n=1 Tax=Prevotella communis TaxID=2913614 RepID=A0A1H0KFP3_9BACT|nr:hypothetical protein [Prevotella communis]SDO54725.1 hypothetical protein SAMN04487900_12543 [Prevotella communis]
MIQFHNATDIDGHIVHINEVTKENRAGHYYCVGCGGEMSAVLGDKREHHFRHKEAHCSWESYLHKLGKLRLKERFESQKEFIIKYYVEHHCDMSKGCKLEPIYKNQKCNRRELISLDLKKIYDTCEEEVTYKGYRADLMLSSSEHPEFEPIFLEISVTHDCEPEKLSSGIQIIEMKIGDEKDVLRPLVEEDSPYGRSNPEHPYDFNAMPPIRFFNFKRIYQTARPLERFWISKDDKGILRGNCIQDNLTCRNVGENHLDTAIFEVAIPAEVLYRNQKPNLYEFGMMKAINAGIDVRHCAICKEHNICILNYNVEVPDEVTGDKKLVPRQKRMINISDQELDKVAQASGCSYYSQNGFFVYRVLRNYQHLIFWEWKKAD